MVKLDKIYTRGGDKGQTSLGNGDRVPKHDARVTAYGAVDECNSVLGLVRRDIGSDEAADTMLVRIQNDLFDLGADLCTPYQDDPKWVPLRISQGQVDRLEAEIDAMNADIPPLKSFVLPGGSAVSSWLHLARTIARRAERHMTLLAEKEKINPLALVYINRLSDHLFVMARAQNNNGADDFVWMPGENR
ncbi:MAG: cob(I)yrinic acid a,c-diamide adenosyltransferase [Rhodospirillaceae bacterium]|nr:cob(I)yrinic acid a,c-diamide adenosyltransferase [Rhodospirillaceae bacterium]